MINTDLSIQHRWVGRRGFNNTFTVTVTNSGSAFNLSTYTFVLNIRRIGGTTNLLQLTQGSGITNGGATGILNVQLTAAQSSSIDADSYYYELIYTVNSLSYGLLHGTFDNLLQYNPENENNDIEVAVNLAGTDVNLAITLAGSGGGGTWGSITGTLSSQTDLQTALDGKVNDSGNETIAGVKTFSSDPIVPDEVYGGGWNGSMEPPTKNAVYDKIETISAGGVQSVTGDGVDNTDPDNPVLSFPDPSDIGLGNVDNTSDADKPVSTATQTALDAILNLPISRTITDSDSLQAGDVNSILDVNIATTKTLTVATQADESVFYILRRGAGELTFVQSGVTITPSLGALTDGGEDTIVTLIFTSTTTAILQNGAPVSISSSDVIAALGYTPANADRQWSLPILKSANQIVNHASAATVTDITDLSFSVVAGLYQVRGWFLMDAGNNTEGHAIQMHTDATVVYTRQSYDSYTTTTAMVFRPANAEDGVANAATTLQANGINRWTALLEVSNSGTVQFAITTEGNSINVTVQKDSGIEYRKLR